MTKEELKKELEKQILQIYKELPPFVEIEKGVARNRTNAELQTLRLANIVHKIMRDLL